MRDFGTRVREIEQMLAHGLYTQAAKESAGLVEHAFRELLRSQVSRLEGRDRLAVSKAELEIGKGDKGLEDFTMGQLVGVLRKASFFDAWALATGRDLHAVRLINFDALVDLRNSLQHAGRDVSEAEARMLYGNLRVVLEAFGVLTLEELAGRPVPATAAAAAGREGEADRPPVPTDGGAESAPTVATFAARLGQSPARVFALAREVLRLELRTPSAVLRPDQAAALEVAIRDGARAEAEPVRSLDLGDGVRLELALVPAGAFDMGSPGEEDGRNDDEPLHPVVISKPFYLGRFPVTQAQYERLTRSNPSYFVGATLPVEMVSWFDAVDFCELLSRALRASFRLPTEAEWEYACRAGTRTAFSTGDAIGTDQANFDWRIGSAAGGVGEPRRRTTPVDQFPANPLGLHDLHGNLWEWCQDWYGEYPRRAVTDPTGPADGSIRILRGGSWFHGPADARSAQRDALDPGRRHSIYGFRVVMEP